MADEPRRRVLIVDDEPLILEVLSEHFKVDFDVETAPNGADALGAVLRQRPDVVLLDINMPGINGLQVLRDIKKVDAKIPVIMVTANDQIAAAEEALKNGAFAYLPKPFHLQYAQHLVEAALFEAPTKSRGAH